MNTELKNRLIKDYLTSTFIMHPEQGAPYFVSPLQKNEEFQTFLQTRRTYHWAIISSSNPYFVSEDMNHSNNQNRLKAEAEKYAEFDGIRVFRESRDVRGQQDEDYFFPNIKLKLAITIAKKVQQNILIHGDETGAINVHWIPLTKAEELGFFILTRLMGDRDRDMERLQKNEITALQMRIVLDKWRKEGIPKHWLIGFEEGQTHRMLDLNYKRELIDRLDPPDHGYDE